MDFKYWHVEQKSEEWVEARKEIAEEGVSASVIAEFYDLGFESWKSLLYPELKKQKVNECINWGNDHEDIAVDDFLTHNSEFLAVNPGLLKRGYVGASLDRILWDKNTGKLTNLEVKCPHPFFSTLPTEPKPRVLIQTLAQMYVTGLNHSIILFWQPKAYITFEYSFEESVWEEIQKDIVEFKKAQKDKPKRNPFKLRGLEILKILKKIKVTIREWQENKHIALNAKENKRLKT